MKVVMVTAWSSLGALRAVTQHSLKYLIYWCLRKLADILRTFLMHFLQWECLNVNHVLRKFILVGLIHNTGSDNGFMPNRQKSITWINHGLLYLCIYAGCNGLIKEGRFSTMPICHNVTVLVKNWPNANTGPVLDRFYHIMACLKASHQWKRVCHPEYITGTIILAPSL